MSAAEPLLEESPLLEVVIPVRNEEFALADTVHRVTRHLDTLPWTWQVTIADNASTDGTPLEAHRLAREQLAAAGFTVEEESKRIRKTGVAVSFVATDGDGDEWLFDVAGSFTSHRGGLLRSEAVWRALGRASALKASRVRGDVFD